MKDEDYYTEIEDFAHWKIGEYLTTSARDVLMYSFRWADTPQGERYWDSLYEGQRRFTQEDYDILCWRLKGITSPPADINDCM